MIKIIESNFIGIPLTRQFLKFCTTEFSIINPKYAVEQDPKKRQEMVEVFRGYDVDFKHQLIKIKRGLKPQVLHYFYKNNIPYEIEDVTVKKNADITFEFENPTWKLLPYQQIALDIFLKRGFGVISFDCGMGKTVTALNIACHLKQTTIVLVHTNALLTQWVKQIQINVKGDYSIGLVGDGTYRLGDITVALFQSFRTLVDNEIFSSFGMVIVDECHHIPAETFYDVITKFRCKYILGLSATLKRKDKMEFLLEYSIGKCLYEKHREDTGLKEVLFIRRLLEIPKVTRVIDKKTNQISTKPFKLMRYIRGSKKKFPNWVDAIGAVCYLQSRTDQIIHDITAAIRQGRKCLVLSDRVEHCKQIYTILQPYCQVKLAIGGDSDNLDLYRTNPELLDVLVGTKIADEGLDIPALDTLFLTCPLSLKDIAGDENTSILDQRIGRIARVYSGKEEIHVYLYHDMMIEYFNSTCNEITQYLQRKKYLIKNLN